MRTPANWRCVNILKMKKKLTLSVLLLFTALSFSQDFKEKREKIKALKHINIQGSKLFTEPCIDALYSLAKNNTI